MDVSGGGGVWKAPAQSLAFFHRSVKMNMRSIFLLVRVLTSWRARTHPEKKRPPALERG